MASKESLRSRSCPLDQAQRVLILCLSMWMSFWNPAAFHTASTCVPGHVRVTGHDVPMSRGHDGYPKDASSRKHVLHEDEAAAVLLVAPVKIFHGTPVRLP